MRKRRLLDSGVLCILETCSSLFSYAGRQRHPSPYAENPFLVIEVNRMPTGERKPVDVLDQNPAAREVAANFR